MHSIEDLKKNISLDYINQIWMAIMQMDSFGLNDLLDNNIDYEDIGKANFIEKLNDRFNEYKTWGDSELYIDLGSCNYCNKDKAICKFSGNNSGETFALFFEIHKGEITDIYHCNYYVH